VTTTITNAGTIALTEDYTPPVLGNSSVVNGSLSQLSNRYGIHILSGNATTATISNSGDLGRRQQFRRHRGRFRSDRLDHQHRHDHRQG
jgi:hypothetical protein